MQKSSKRKGHKNMLTKLLIGAAGAAAGYFGAMYLVSFAMLKDPKRMHDLVDKAQERAEARRVQRADEMVMRIRQQAVHQPFGVWNPTHPTDPASR